MRLVVVALLLFPFISFASTGKKTPFPFLGGALYCKADEDIGKVGYLVEDIKVGYATADKETLDFSFMPKFYVCAKGAQGFFWKDSSVVEAMNSEVKTRAGAVKIIPVTYQWVTYTEYYKVLQPLVSANGCLNFQFKKSEILKSEKDQGFVTIFLSFARKAVYPDGQELDLGLRSSGSIEVAIKIPTL